MTTILTHRATSSLDSERTTISLKNVPTLIPAILREKVAHSSISLSCYYAGCGSADSWPLYLN